MTQGGGFAGEVVIKEGGVVKLPKDVDLVAAAGLPVIFGTAHLAIKERAQVKPGWLFVVACSIDDSQSSRLCLLSSYKFGTCHQYHLMCMLISFHALAASPLRSGSLC